MSPTNPHRVPVRVLPEIFLSGLVLLLVLSCSSLADASSQCAHPKLRAAGRSVGNSFSCEGQLFISADHKNFVLLGSAKNPMPIAGQRLWWYTLTDMTSVSGRYIQVRVVPGQSAEWTFIDEIEVRQ